MDVWYLAWYHNCDIDDPLTVLVPVGAPRSSARLNHKNVSFISTGMNCACDVSTLFGIFLTIGTCLCITGITSLPHDLRLWNLLNPAQQEHRPSQCTATVDSPWSPESSAPL